MKRALLLALWLLAACSSASDDWNGAEEPVVVRAYVDRADVVPGKPFTLTVEVDQDVGAQFELPDPSVGLGRLEVIKTDAAAPQTANGRVLYQHSVTLRAPKEGTYAIPGFEGPWRLGDEAGNAGSGPILLEAKNLGGAEEGDGALRDLHPPAAPDPDRRALALAAGLLAALLAVGALLWNRARKGSQPEPSPSPHDLARAALSRLEGEVERTEQGPFAYEVSAVLRRYLEGRFGFRAWRMTTPEVLRALPAELARDRDLESAIRSVLEASDRVKFAGVPVPTSELRSWLLAVRSVVDRTPAPEPEA